MSHENDTQVKLWPEEHSLCKNSDKETQMVHKMLQAIVEEGID